MSKLNEVMGRGYSTRPLVFLTATSEIFRCDFATRDDGLVLQFYPHMSAHVSALHGAVKEAFADVLGHRAPDILLTEVVSDDEAEIPPNVYVHVSDFAQDETAARSVFERGIRGAYDRLKAVLG